MPSADISAVALAGLAGLFALMAIVGCLVTLVTLVAVRRYARRPPAPALRDYPAVTILKPLYGDEPDLADNLASFCSQVYPGEVEIVFGVQRATDPALAVARRVAAEHPACRARFVVEDRRQGRNGKVSNLVNMTTSIHHELVVLSDSDIRVTPDYLRRVVNALGAPGIGLVTCLYRGAVLPNVWSRLLGAGIDGHFLPNVILGLTLGLAKPCFGSTIALRRETLAAIGGFSAVRDTLADDNAIGQAVRHLGLGAAIPLAPLVDHVCAADTARALFAQDLRWSRTIRAVDPGGFAGSIVTNPLPLAAIAWLFDGFGLWTGSIVLLALACRRALQHTIVRVAGTSPQPYWVGPARDFLSLAVFVASFWPGSLDWRGQRFEIEADGTMAPPGQTGR